MKLYATITSERASKGQGGNKYLEIEIQAEKLQGIPTRANIYRINLDVDDDGFLLGSILDYSTGKRTVLHKLGRNKIELEVKGEKQKGEMREVVMYHCKKHGTYDKKCSDCILSNLPLI